MSTHSCMVGFPTPHPTAPTMRPPHPRSTVRRASAKASLLTASLALLGCQEPPAISVTVELEAPGEQLCLGLSHPSLPASLRYGWALEGIEPPYTVTLVPGPMVSDEVRISAWALGGIHASGRSAATVAFPERGSASAVLTVRACTPRSPSGRGTRPGGTFASLRDPPRLLAGDLDADGRDELFATGADDSLQVLDAEVSTGGSVRRTDLATRDGGASDVADLDGDCFFDLVATSSTGTLFVDGETGDSPAPVGPSATDARMGPFAELGRPGVLVATASEGLQALPWPRGAAREIAPHTFEHLDVRVVGRLALALASGAEAGTHLYSFDRGEPTDATDELPTELQAATGPGVSTSFGLVVASGRDLLFGVRDDGTLRFEAGPTFSETITRVVAVDLDGDCVDDVVVRGASGGWAAYRGRDLEPFDVPSIHAIDLVAGDIDGDGAFEVAILGAGGRVTLWSP